MQATNLPRTRADMIRHCADILRRKGHYVDVTVQTGVNDSLRPDIVTRTTVYEIREILAKTPLLAGTGQGLLYAQWLRRNRVVVVGYLPTGADLGDSLTTISNLERVRLVKVSVIDEDPFWELASVSYRPIGYAALLVGAIALAVFAIPLLREEVGCRIYPALRSCAPDRAYQSW